MPRRTNAKPVVEEEIKEVTEEAAEEVTEEAAEEVTEEAADEAAEELLLGTVIGGSLNVRRSPEVGNNILGVIAEGTEVKILNEMPGWYEISYEGHEEAYVMAEFIKL